MSSTAFRESGTDVEYWPGVFTALRVSLVLTVSPGLTSGMRVPGDVAGEGKAYCNLGRCPDNLYRFSFSLSLSLFFGWGHRNLTLFVCFFLGGGRKCVPLARGDYEGRPSLLCYGLAMGWIVCDGSTGSGTEAGYMVRRNGGGYLGRL